MPRWDRDVPRLRKCRPGRCRRGGERQRPIRALFRRWKTVGLARRIRAGRLRDIIPVPVLHVAIVVWSNGRRVCSYQDRIVGWKLGVVAPVPVLTMVRRCTRWVLPGRPTGGFGRHCDEFFPSVAAAEAAKLADTKARWRREMAADADGEEDEPVGDIEEVTVAQIAARAAKAAAAE